MACDDGYTLKCLVSASYGRTAGSCVELEDNPYGCGISYDESPIICESDDTLCNDVELEGCKDSLSGDYYSAISGCQDCMPVCGCGMDAPQFYNVADCFGDTTSTICSGQNGDTDPQNIYLPLTVWNNDCKDKQECTLTLSNNGASSSDILSCWNTEFNYENVYYAYINGQPFDRFNDVVKDEMYSTCAYMDLKVLGVCQYHLS